MNKRILVALIFFLPLFLSYRLQASTEDQLNSIETLGALNGVALQCGYLQQAGRIKSALIVNLPKERQLGRLFEEVTNKSFLASLEDPAGCPGEEALAERVDAGITTLKKAFPD